MKAENESKNMFKTKSIFLLITIILGIIAVVLGVTYAYWKTSFTQEGFNTVASQCFKIDFEESNDINLTNTISILNSEGEQLKPYNITFRNICDNDIKYQVNLETLTDDEKLDDKYITVKVNYGDNKILTNYENTNGIVEGHSNAYKLLDGHLRKDQVMSVDVRMWIGEEVKLSEEVMDKTFKSKVTIEAEIENQTGDYKEEILNGTDPVLEENLIPIIIGENGTVTRADTTKKWYNYANSEWANAVILAETAKDPGAGKPIPEDDIESYFVWIPKYSYQLWDLGLYEDATEVDEDKVHTIPIKFGTTDTKDTVKGECTTPMTTDGKQGKSGDSGNCDIGEFMTHPAFLSFGVNGLWVGKFETGYKDAHSTEDAEDVTNTNNVATEEIIIKPNVYSWRNIDISNSYQNAYNYKRELLDSHMMKNTEWGAVAYLTNSIYGKCNSNGNCEKVQINAASDYKTGAKDDSNNYSNNQETSTTGNYTGIYDMNGGAWEQMASATKEENNDMPIISDSGLSSGILTAKKYYDLYNYYNNQNHWERRILGDATGELGPFKNTTDYYISSFFGSYSRFVNATAPWFYRGGAKTSGSTGGVFAFHHIKGSANSDHTFRIVLAPQSKS